MLRRLLALLLLVWEPLTLALTAASFADRLGERGWPAVVLLVARLGITGLCMAAGSALWAQRDGAMALARWATGLNLAAVAVTATTGIWPSSRPPGIRGPAAAVTIAWHAAWFLWTLRQDDRT